MVTTTEARQVLERATNDPEWYWRSILGVEHIFPKQIAIPLSVREHRRTSVVGCNSSSKDHTAGRIMLWWMGIYEQAKVIVIGPTYRQVADIVFMEARVAFQGARFPLGGMMYETPRYEISPDRFALGFSTDRPYNIQGFHSPHLLAIITEAHGVQQSHIDAVKRLNPERMLLTGNPLSTGGEFYESHHGGRGLYNCIQISAFETPNIIEGKIVIPGMVTVEDVEERREEYGEDSPMYIASILGEFPDNLDDAIVLLRDALAARERTLDPEGDAVLGVDVARYGEDATVIYKRQGSVARKIWKAQGRNLMEVSGKVLELAQDDLSITAVVIDDTGIGGGVTDRLREVGLPKRVRLIPFIGGSRAHNPKKFFNSVAEAWWAMRSAFQDGTMDIEDDRALISQVTTRHYMLQSDRTIRLESKEDMKKRGGKSPDEADALAMTFAVSTREVTVRPSPKKQSSWRD